MASREQISQKAEKKPHAKISEKSVKLKKKFNFEGVDPPLVYGGFQGFNDWFKLPGVW